MKFYVSSLLPGKENLRNCAFIPRPESPEKAHNAQRKNPMNTFGYSHHHPTKSWHHHYLSIKMELLHPLSTNYIRPQNKGLLAWHPWLSGHLASRHLASGHPNPCHPSLWPPLLLLPSHCFVLNPCLSPPTLARLILFPENRSPLNPACTLSRI